MAHGKLSSRERVVLRWAAAVFLAILADGAVRKWLLPASLQAIPYCAKDVLAALFLAAYPQPKEPPWAKRLTPFALGIGLCLAPAFMLGLTKVPVGAVGVFKNAVLWPLFAIRMGSYLTEAVIDRLWKLALACSVLMAALAIAQYFAGPASVLNRYAWDDISALSYEIALAGTFVRATGTFSYITGLASFSLAMFCLFLGRSLAAKRGSELWLGVAGLASAVVCGLVSGSRGIQVFMAAISTIVVIFISKKQGVRLISGILGVAVVFALLWNSSLAEGVFARWNATGDGEFESRVKGTGQPITETLLANPVGIGLGLYTGFASTAGIQNGVDLAYNESGPNKVAAEAGVLGYMAILLGLGLIIRATLWTLAADSVRKSRVLPIAVGALMQLVLGLWYDHASSALWWWVIALWLGEGLAGKQLGRATPRLGRQPEVAVVPGV